MKICNSINPAKNLGNLQQFTSSNCGKISARSVKFPTPLLNSVRFSNKGTFTYLLSFPGLVWMSSNRYRFANNINAFIGLLGLSEVSWVFLVGVVGGESRNAVEGDSSDVGKLNLKQIVYRIINDWLQYSILNLPHPHSYSILIW